MLALPGIRRVPAAVWAAALAVVSVGCVFVPPPPLPEEAAAQHAQEEARLAALRAGEAASGGAPGAAAVEAGDGPVVGMSAEEIRAYAAAQGDPELGDFTLDEAMAGLSDRGELWARFHTARGVIECRLLENQAPVTVANFVGLARGLRPFRDVHSGQWEKRNYYDGTLFHRVIPGFMIQGGDPLGTGTGNAGYVIVDEIRPELIHDGAGVLSMANRGPGTGSSQFFITLGPTPHLDGKHTVFGKCTEEGIRVADDIASVPRDPMDKPAEDEVLQKLEIVRK